MLDLRQIYKSFENKRVLADISFQIQDGEIVVLLGPSGGGKSTLLAIIAGLEPADSGQIVWDGEDISQIPTYQRGFGLMFQDYALFPNRNVFGNVAFGLEMAAESSDEVREKVNRALERVDLVGFAGRDIATLSGGEQQRVALARALAPTPKLLMLDEPLGSLDRTLRTQLLEELGRILRSNKQGSLYVTHDQEEAFAIADRIVIIDGGRVVQVGTPEELYRRPGSVFVARFFGFENFISGRVDSIRTLHTKFGDFDLPGMNDLGDVLVLLRPDRLELGRGRPFVLRGELVAKQFRGNQVWVEMDVNETRLKLALDSNAELPGIGEAIEISFDPEDALLVFPEDR